MRLAPLLPALLLVRLALPVFAAGEVPAQAVTPIVPQVEQRVEPIVPAGEQHVEALDAAGVQKITTGSKGPARRVVDAVAKVVIGVMATAVAVGATIAGVLFF